MRLKKASLETDFLNLFVTRHNIGRLNIFNGQPHSTAYMMKPETKLIEGIISLPVRRYYVNPIPE